jgi:hypothetical protein
LSERVSSRKLLADLIEKLGIETFEKLAIDLLEYGRSGRILLDISLTRSLVGGEAKIFDELSDKYKIDKVHVRNALNSLSYLLRTVIANKREVAMEKFSIDEKLSSKASALVEMGERLINRYPELRERFYLTTFSKTSYIGDVDWEIVIKVVEPQIYEFEKKDRFPVCILRFILEKSPLITRPFFPRQKELVFEASLSDVEKLVTIFSEIRDKMIKVNKDLMEESG